MSLKTSSFDSLKFTERSNTADCYLFVVSLGDLQIATTTNTAEHIRCKGGRHSAQSLTVRCQFEGCLDFFSFSYNCTKTKCFTNYTSFQLSVVTKAITPANHIRPKYASANHDWLFGFLSLVKKVARVLPSAGNTRM